MGFRPEPAPPAKAQADTGVLLVNLGTPDAPTARALRRYLKEFLSDPRVVEIPRLAWWPILNGVILNTRPARSALKYASIWTRDGSPLKFHTERQMKLVKGLIGADGGAPVLVDYAMRYGTPNIADALDRMKAAGAGRILILPLYPQYSGAATGSAFDAVAAWGQHSRNLPELRFIRGFHDDPGYIAALAASVREHWAANGRGGKLLMSFHGLPRRSVALGDPYRRECEETAARLAKKLGLEADDWVLCFQSRFGRAQWLEPYTQPTLERLAREGVGEADVICPGFVADCLETLEEIGMECKAAFLAAGGRRFSVIPCLNERSDWIAALAGIVGASL